MSLPNDDENSRPPWRNPVGSDVISPIKKLTVASSDADERTADETSIGSMSFSSDITSVAGMGLAQHPPANPLRPGQTARPDGLHEAAMSAHVNPENDDNSIQSSVGFQNNANSAAMRVRRGRNRRQLQRLGIATGTAFALFIYMLIPTALLLSMILFGTVSSVFLYQLADVLRWEFHRSILEGRGIGDYLPQGLYRLLTSTSLHEFLSDPDGIFGASEHIPYLMLYMIPGLTPEQLEQYVSRLSPTHQRLLRSEQGLLGYYLNRNNHRNADADNGNSDSTLMRVVMGDERLREWRQVQQHSDTPLQSTFSNVAPRRLELPPTIPEGPEESIPAAPAPRRISEPPAPPQGEGGSSQTIPEPPSPGIPETVAALVGNGSDANNFSPAPARDVSQPSGRPSLQTHRSPERNESTSNDIILLDAVRSAVANVVSDATSSVREQAEETLRVTLAIPMYRVSLGVTALGLGVGALGLANGTYDLRSLTESIGRLVSQTVAGILGGGGSETRLRPSLSMPSGGFLLGSTIASGTTAVVLGLFARPTNGGGDGGASDGGPAAKSPGNSEDPSSSPQAIQ
eukprot:CAMPEP_0197180072 /NCGR_PEP_ID=MMETSP1423-20130617/4815_1 /TAXON_ID=476441 /ORGANISM="Pseudo-nitzschia heimii, Strain UNC1101" /LENGTH=571 /DNA_ID=CAMNT_0042630093 /DNA_START=421 /DNA_END=2136 /DNA_ORIENTATION=+